MRYDEFYSLRLSEVLDFIEVNNKKEIDNTNLNFILFGQLCATIANFSMNKPKNKKFKAKDFFKQIDEIKKQKRKQSSDEMAKILEALTLAMGGEIKNG